MRRIVLAMMMAAAVQGAQAADYPDDLPILRGGFRDGVTGVPRWQGVYVGVQYGGSNSSFGGPSVNAPLASLAASAPFASTAISTTMLPDQTTANGVGGFVGYNWQWDDIILGVDANYNVGGQRGLSFITPVTNTVPYGGGLDIEATTSGSATMKITDYGAIRARAGWAVGIFLPYVTGGFSMGRADMARTITVTGTIDPGGAATPYGPVNTTQTKSGAFIYGFSYGGGLDVMLTRGLFARGEVEVNRFTAAWGMDATVTTLRGGLGYRF